LFGGAGGAGCLQMGRVGIMKKKESCRQRGHILTFSDGFTDGNFVGDSDGKIDTSPYGSGISNPSVIPLAF
jgi:hypothetical protein